MSGGNFNELLGEIGLIIFEQRAVQLSISALCKSQVLMCILRSHRKGRKGGVALARANLMHVTPDMTLQSHLYLYKASAAIPLHKSLNKKQV